MTYRENTITLSYSPTGVSAVSKNKREVVAVVGVAVAKLHPQLCPMHQQPVKTGRRVQDVQVAMLLLISASLHERISDGYHSTKSDHFSFSCYVTGQTEEIGDPHSVG